jgi:hypothetical protein
MGVVAEDQIGAGGKRGGRHGLLIIGYLITIDTQLNIEVLCS